MGPTRRLAAILAFDVAGYSRLMRDDEEGTHERLKTHRRELVDPAIRGHHGRIVKFTGDGMLVEFSSVVEAVWCAVEVQCGMHARNAEAADQHRIAFRIGVNLGDVIAEPEDIYGDGVNIAARLEALAEPDGICISQVVYEQVRDKLPYQFEDLGHLSVKNIARPVHAFALGAEAIAALPAADVPIQVRAGPVGSASAGPPRFSIVVLPFANLSDDREQQYLAEAITDDITTDLSRIPEMVVISRSTAYTYRDKPIDSRHIGSELNVRYVLQGSVRSAGRRVRINTQLIDAETDAHVWADRFDHQTEDLFALQDEVTSQIAVALNLELVGAEAARPAANPDALDYILRGRAAIYRGPTRENFGEAIDRFSTALTLDRDSIPAKGLLAAALAARVLDHFSDSAAADLDAAEALVAEARHGSSGNALVYFAGGQVLRARRRFDAAIPEYEKALSVDRNFVAALAALGLCKFLTGSIEEAIPAQEQAIRLSPRDPHLPNWYWRIGMVHLLQSRPEEAVRWLERARRENPRLAGPHGWLASAYGLLGDRQRAAAELAEARRLGGDGRYASIARFKGAQFWAPSVQALAEGTFLAGLRNAGIPES